jgi:hypothetical protein
MRRASSGAGDRGDGRDQAELVERDHHALGDLAIVGARRVDQDLERGLADLRRRQGRHRGGGGGQRDLGLGQRAAAAASVSSGPPRSTGTGSRVGTVRSPAPMPSSPPRAIARSSAMRKSRLSVMAAWVLPKPR